MRSQKLLTSSAIWAIFFIAIVFIAFNACRKLDSVPREKSIDAITQKFFTIKPGTDPKVVSIAESVKRQNDQRKFVQKLTKNAGFPI